MLWLKQWLTALRLRRDFRRVEEVLGDGNGNGTQ